MLIGTVLRSATRLLGAVALPPAVLCGVALALSAIPLAAPASAFSGVETALAAHPYARHVAEASQRFGIPERWIWSVMRVESGGNWRAVSPVGAQGLMQIMPGTWAMLTARYGLGADPFDVRANIHGGAAYLRLMWDRYRRIDLMLAAYNAGPGRADAFAAGRRRLPTETIAYVARIAPALGTSTGAAQSALPSPAPRSWRDAALFSGRADGPSVDADEAVEGTMPRREPEATMAAHDPASPTPHPLFIPLSGRDR